jgi:predicted Zn-dependent protease
MKTTRTSTLLALIFAGALLAPAVSAQAPSASKQAFDRAMAEIEAGRQQAALAILEPLRRDPKAEGPAISLLSLLYLQAGRPADAAAVLEPFTRQDPPDPAVLYHAAQAASALNQPEKAEAFLQRSAELAPASPAARELGILRSRQRRAVDALQLLGPWLDAQPDDQQARVVAVQSAIQLSEVGIAESLVAGLDDKLPVTQLLRAQVALQKGETESALAALRPLLDGKAGSIESDARGLAAEAYLALDKPTEAIKVLSGKIGKDPALALMLARALRQVGSYGEAANALKPFADEILAATGKERVFPLAGAIALEYGRILVDSGRSREGSAALKRAVVLNPVSLPGWQTLAEAARAIGDIKTADEAQKRFDQLAAAARQSIAPQASGAGDAPANLAVMGPVMDALLAGDPEKALTMVRAEGARVPQDPRPQLLEVRILLSLNREAEATHAAEGVVVKFPQLPDAIYQRGVLRLNQGDAKGAEQDLRKALQLSPTHTAALNDLAVLLMTKKQFAEAKTLLQKALALNPQDALAQQNFKSLPPGT